MIWCIKKIVDEFTILEEMISLELKIGATAYVENDVNQQMDVNWASITSGI